MSRAHASLSKLDHPLAFPNWLRRIVFKRCDRMIRGKRPLKIVSTEAALELISSDKNPAELAEEDEVNKLLHTALDHLSEEERQIVELFYISDHSQGQIAEFLGVNISTVKNRMRTARGHLKERLLSMLEEDLQGNRPSQDGSFVDRVLRLIAPQKAEHSEHIFELFNSLGREDLSEMARDGRILDSSHDWQTSRAISDVRQRRRRAADQSALSGAISDVRQSGSVIERSRLELKPPLAAARWPAGVL
jgi:RNA polymerase sigma factor (sigma-70 family)